MEEALRQFEKLAREAVKTHPDVSPLLQRCVGWLGDGIKPGQSVTPTDLKKLGFALNHLNRNNLSRSI